MNEYSKIKLDGLRPKRVQNVESNCVNIADIRKDSEVSNKGAKAWERQDSKRLARAKELADAVYNHPSPSDR